MRQLQKAQKQFDAEHQLSVLLKFIEKSGEKFDDAHLLNVFLGLETAQTIAYEHSKVPEFGIGKEEGELMWKSIIRQAVLNNYLFKDIDNYGLLKLTKQGRDFIVNPYSLKFILNEPIENGADDDDDDVKQGTGALDTHLLSLLKELRKKLQNRKVFRHSWFSGSIIRGNVYTLPDYGGRTSPDFWCRFG